MSAPQFEPVIGLEIHTQLATESKLFCSCPARPQRGISVSELEINQNTCPVCTGQPGALPVLNRRAVEYAIRAGLATGCQIRERSVFSRKNYFYPDSPKGYQISQFDLPICHDGFLDIETAGVRKRVVIERMHIEEDAGKTTHHDGYSIVNLNRCSVPLIEIVSAPDMRSAEEAGAYMRALYEIVTHTGVCDGNLQEGNFRCDANVSVRPLGAEKFGTRVEIKNINSFKFVEDAIRHETARQIQVISSGGKIVQETRLYDSDRGVTVSMRTKEEAQDYRYVEDPDLLPIVVSEAEIQRIRSSLPELPEQKRARYQSELGLSAYDAGVLTADGVLNALFEGAIAGTPAAAGVSADLAKGISNLITGDIAKNLKETEQGAARMAQAGPLVRRIAELQLKSEISSAGSKQVIKAMFEASPALDPSKQGSAWVDAQVEKLGLKQVSDLSALEPLVDEVIAASPAQVAEFRAGKEKVLGFLVGQLMKKSAGKGNPALFQELLRKKLTS